MIEYTAAELSTNVVNGVVNLVLTVDAEQPEDDDWSVSYVERIRIEPGQAMTVQIIWAG